MAKRNLVHIDEDKCDGCGICVDSCAEGAIQIIDNKAKLVSDTYCDGLGSCLGHCPQDAITVELAEAKAFDEAAVEIHLEKLKQAEAKPAAPAPALNVHAHGHGGGCPGSRMLQFEQDNKPSDGPVSPQPSQLRQWPVQLHLVSPVAPYFEGAEVVLAADCVAFAVGDFHQRFLKGKALAVCCPKLDSQQEIYEDKLVAMIDEARIEELHVLIMQVPCCRGLLGLAQRAADRAQRSINVKCTVIGVQGEILAEELVRGQQRAAV